MSADSPDKTAKKARKDALKKEAKAMGITYDELKAQKKQKKSRKREADNLETDEHKTERKRMRSWSKDLSKPDKEPSETETKRRRTRSMDAAEEKEEKEKQDDATSPEEWRKENSITVKGHGKHASDTEFPVPFYNFKDTPFNGVVLKSFETAGFEKPTLIQSQVS